MSNDFVYIHVFILFVYLICYVQPDLTLTNRATVTIVAAKISLILMCKANFQCTTKIQLYDISI